LADSTNLTLGDKEATNECRPVPLAFIGFFQGLNRHVTALSRLRISKKASQLVDFMERETGLEPACSAWEQLESSTRDLARNPASGRDGLDEAGRSRGGDV